MKNEDYLPEFEHRIVIPFIQCKKKKEIFVQSDSNASESNRFSEIVKAIANSFAKIIMNNTVKIERILTNKKILSMFVRKYEQFLELGACKKINNYLHQQLIDYPAAGHTERTNS